MPLSRKRSHEYTSETHRLSKGSRIQKCSDAYEIIQVGRVEDRIYLATLHVSWRFESIFFVSLP